MHWYRSRMKILRSGILAAALLASLSAATTASASKPTCHGKPVTIKQAASGQTTVGTNGDDVILLRHAGTVRAGAGADIVCGSASADVIDAGPGRDIVLAGAGRDTISGGRGIDHIYGEGGSDRMSGGSGRDFLVGGAGVDALPRQAGDTVVGGAYAVSVSLQMNDVEQFYMDDQMIGLTRTNGGLTPLASMADPMPAVGYGLGELGAYISTTTPQPFSVVNMSVLVPAPIGSVVNITPAMQVDVVPGQAPAETIQFANQSAMTLATGLAQEVTADNGAPVWAPILISPFGTPAYAVQSFNAPTAVSVFPFQASAPGLLLEDLPPGAATSSVTPQHPTATFTWNAANGQFQAG